MKKILCLLLLCLSTAAIAAEKNILFIGNSYTGGIRKTFSKLVEAEKTGAKVEYFNPGGKTLLWHSQQKKVSDKIKSQKWDIIVLQDQSQTPAYFPQNFLKGATALKKQIDANGAQALFYMTWGRRDGDKRNAHVAPTFEKMQQMLTDNYSAAAKQLGIPTAPAGPAWAEVKKKSPETFKELYRKDGSHPSAKGAYLTSIVIYCRIFNKKPADISFKNGLNDQVTVFKVVIRCCCVDTLQKGVAFFL